MSWCSFVGDILEGGDTVVLETSFNSGGRESILWEWSRWYGDTEGSERGVAGGELHLE